MAVTALGDDLGGVAGPMMWTPRISPYFASETTLMKPSCASRMVALELPTKGNLPTLTL